MFRKQNQGFSLTHILIVVLAIAGVVLIGFGIKHGSEVAAEKQSYKEADAQITSFVNDAAKLAPSTKEIKRYCERSSVEYGEGYLGCSIRGTVEFRNSTVSAQKQIMSSLDDKQQELPWQFAYDNTSNNKDYPNVIKVIVYKYKELSCGVDYSYKSSDSTGKNYDKATLVIDASCDGSALQEYYK